MVCWHVSLQSTITIRRPIVNIMRHTDHPLPPLSIPPVHGWKRGAQPNVGRGRSGVPPSWPTVTVCSFLGGGGGSFPPDSFCWKERGLLPSCSSAWLNRSSVPSAWQWTDRKLKTSPSLVVRTWSVNMTSRRWNELPHAASARHRF